RRRGCRGLVGGLERIGRGLGARSPRNQREQQGSGKGHGAVLAGCPESRAAKLPSRWAGCPVPPRPEHGAPAQGESASICAARADAPGGSPMRFVRVSSVLAPLGASLVALAIAGCGDRAPKERLAPPGPPLTPTLEQVKAATVSG